MERFSEDLKNQVIKVINYEKKEMIPLTNDEKNSYEKQKVCYICKKEFCINKNWAPFTKCITIINGTDIDNAQDIDIVMPMYSLIEYSDNYSKTSGSLWQHYKDHPNDNLVRCESFKSKIKITGKTAATGNTKDFFFFFYI